MAKRTVEWFEQNSAVLKGEESEGGDERVVHILDPENAYGADWEMVILFPDTYENWEKNGRSEQFSESALGYDDGRVRLEWTASFKADLKKEVQKMYKFLAKNYDF